MITCFKRPLLYYICIGLLQPSFQPAKISFYWRLRWTKVSIIAWWWSRWMSEVDNLVGKSVGSTENSHACYLAVWSNVETGSGHPGHPGQTWLTGSDPDWITWAVKLIKHDMEAQWWLPLLCSLREPRPLFETMILLAANARRAPPFISFVHIHATITIYSSTSITVAGALPLQYAKTRIADL